MLLFFQMNFVLYIIWRHSLDFIYYFMKTLQRWKKNSKIFTENNDKIIDDICSQTKRWEYHIIWKYLIQKLITYQKIKNKGTFFQILRKGVTEIDSILVIWNNFKSWKKDKEERIQDIL